MNSSGIISKENKTIFIAGPTASGKTEIAHALAKEIGRAEIISADSMQVYKHMDIITAKPSIEYRWEIPYHLIDSVEVTDSYSASDFHDDAIECIKNILSNGKIPIVVGGTGLYVRTLLKGMFDCPSADWQFREEMQKVADQYGANVLHNLLKERDPSAAASIEPQNVRRVIRALEVYQLTGKRISDLQKSWDKPLSDIHPVMGRLFLWGVYWPRGMMYDRVNKRVGQMIEQGLVDEVRTLINLGIMNNAGASQSIGIKEVSAYLSGSLTKDEAVSLLKRNTRRFVKRQLTWFAKEDNFNWFVLCNEASKPKVVAEMLKQLQSA